jgi:GT2 family glycosyltransferase
MRTFAIIPTHNRHAMLPGLVGSLELPSDRVLVIDNASSPPVTDLEATVVRDDEQPPNISRLWNIGLDWAREQAGDAEYAVAVLNDDLVLPPRFLDVMVDALRRTGAAAAFPARVEGLEELHLTTSGPVPRQARMTGFAFVLRGSAGLRADERFRWWCGDDDLEWTARERGGTVRVPLTVEHLHPGASTDANPVLEARTRLDMDAFVEKWGRRPWREPAQDLK